MRTAFVFALMFLGALTAGSQDKSKPDQSNDQTAIVRSDVNLVATYFTVRDDHKQLVSDLSQNRFRVTEDGKPQPIKFFAHHSDVVLNVGLMLDTGTNMAWMLN